MIHTFDDLLAKLQKAYPPADIEKMRQAYEFAREAHKGQTRRDGELFITHPLSVAEIIVEMGLDAQSVTAGLLHDCVEDTAVTAEQISALFGPQVAQLVDGVTRLGKIMYFSKEEEQMEDLRKMFLAMAKDIRVILIKLADRLHNMRTIDWMPEEKRREKSLETMEIYAPVAHRLGMQKIKWELEDLSLQYLDPVGHKEITDALSERSHEREEFLESIKTTITDRLNEANIRAEIEGRIKHMYSIYRKLYTQHRTLDEIYDICAVRIIVDTLTDCYNVLGFVHDLYKPVPGRFKDYIGTPKQNMYQSLHTTVIGREGLPFEVQIRTRDMHRLAEYGVAAHWKYKQGLSGPQDEETFAWIRQLLESQQDSDAEDFVHTLKVDMFADEVFVFTPKGDVVSLPAGATPIDFAYSIHSAIGNRMVGAKVNGRIVQLDYHLKSGEIVEVITSKEARGPSRDWLKLTKTGAAKNKIKQWFKKERREENIKQGKDELERELRVNLLLNAFNQESVQTAVIKRLSFNTPEDLYAAIGYGGTTVNRVLNRVRDELIRQSKFTALAEGKIEKNVKKAAGSSSGIQVEGIDNCLIKLARCCTPIPGDDIVGFITRGYGVSIHRKDCANVKSGMGNDADSGRWIRVSWAEERKSRYNTGLQISAKNRVALIADIAMVFSSMKISVSELTAKNLNDGFAVIFAMIEVEDISQLDGVTLRLKRVSGVIDVLRSAS